MKTKKNRPKSTNKGGLTITNNYTSNYYNTPKDTRPQHTTKVINYHINAPGTVGEAQAVKQPGTPLHLQRLDMVDNFVIELAEEFSALNLMVRKYYYIAIMQVLADENIKVYTSDEFAEVLTFSHLPKDKLPSSSTLRKYHIREKYPHWKSDINTKNLDRMKEIAKGVLDRKHLLKTRYIKAE